MPLLPVLPLVVAPMASIRSSLLGRRTVVLRTVVHLVRRLVVSRRRRRRGRVGCPSSVRFRSIRKYSNEKCFLIFYMF